MKLNLYPNGKAMAGSMWKMRPAKVHSISESHVEFSVAGYSYTLGARAGNTKSYSQKGYAKAERFSARIVSRYAPPSGLVQLEVEVNEPAKA